MIKRVAWLPLVSVSLLACPADPKLDHYWKHDRCEASFQSGIDWSGMGVAQTTTPKASAYLRRVNGASSLMVQVAGYEIGLADPYPSGPLVRFAISPKTSAPAELRLVPDASDVRGPLVVEPGTAWLIETSRTDKEKPQDDWHFGSGTMKVTALTLDERETSEREFVTLDATFDLSEVRVSPFDPSQGEPKPIGGLLRVRCVDDALLGDSGLPEGGGSGGEGGTDGDGGNGGTGGDPGPVACGEEGSCANPACGDCDGVASNFCETDLRAKDSCGSCTRSCGPSGSCDPLGACEGEAVSQDPATSVTIGGAGVGWIARSAGAVRFLPSGGSVRDVATGATFSQQDRILLNGTELFWASYAGAWHATMPAGAAAQITGVIQPDSVRLIGATASHVYTLTLNEGNAYDVVRRFDRANNYAPEVVACLSMGTYEASVQAGTGVVFVSNGANIARYASVVGGNSCVTTTAGQTIFTAPSGEFVYRVLAGGTRVVFTVQSSAGTTIQFIDANGAGTASTLGTAARVGASVDLDLPLAVDGDTAFWVDAAPLGGTTPARYRIVAATDASTLVPIGIAQEGVTSLAASASGVVFADPSGVFRVAR